MPDTVYKTKKKQKLKPLPSVRKLYKNAKIDSGDARQRLKDLVSAQRMEMGIGPGTYTRATLNGKIVYNGTMLNDEGLPIPDPRYGLIMSGEYVQGFRSPYKDLGHDVRVGVPMIMEVIPGTGLFPKSRTIVNYLGDPGYLDAQNRLAEAYNRNGGNIKIGDEEKPYLLPEVLILYRKNGGAMKKLIPKHLYGNLLIPENQRTIVESEVNLTGIPRVNPLYDLQHISPAVNKTGETGYLRITPKGFGTYTEEFVPKSDAEYYNTVRDLYNQGKLLNSSESTLPRLNEYTKPPVLLNSVSSKLLQKLRTEERLKDDINGYKKYKFKVNSINDI